VVVRDLRLIPHRSVDRNHIETNGKVKGNRSRRALNPKGHDDPYFRRKGAENAKLLVFLFFADPGSMVWRIERGKEGEKQKGHHGKQDPARRPIMLGGKCREGLLT